MRDLAEYLEGVDRVHVESAGRLNPHDIRANVDAMLPTFLRFSERAGVNLHELNAEIEARVEIPVEVIAAQISRGELTMTAGLRMAAIAAGVQFFLVGALWEQDRHMPEVS